MHCPIGDGNTHTHTQKVQTNINRRLKKTIKFIQRMRKRFSARYKTETRCAPAHFLPACYLTEVCENLPKVSVIVIYTLYIILYVYYSRNSYWPYWRVRTRGSAFTVQLNRSIKLTPLGNGRMALYYIERWPHRFSCIKTTLYLLKLGAPVYALVPITKCNSIELQYQSKKLIIDRHHVGQLFYLQ